MAELVLQQQLVEAAKERSNIAKALLAIQDTLDKMRPAISLMESVLDKLEPAVTIPDAILDIGIDEAMLQIVSPPLVAVKEALEVAFPATSGYSTRSHTMCSMECPRHNATASKSASIPAVAPTASLATVNFCLELTTLDIEATGVTTPTPATYLTCGLGHGTGVLELYTGVHTKCSAEVYEVNANSMMLVSMRVATRSATATSMLLVATNSIDLGEELRPLPWPSFVHNQEGGQLNDGYGANKAEIMPALQVHGCDLISGFPHEKSRDPGVLFSCAWHCHWWRVCVNSKGRLGREHSAKLWSPLQGMYGRKYLAKMHNDMCCYGISFELHVTSSSTDCYLQAMAETRSWLCELHAIGILGKCWLYVQLFLVMELFISQSREKRQYLVVLVKFVPGLSLAWHLFVLEAMRNEAMLWLVSQCAVSNTTLVLPWDPGASWYDMCTNFQVDCMVSLIELQPWPCWEASYLVPIVVRSVSNNYHEIVKLQKVIGEGVFILQGDGRKVEWRPLPLPSFDCSGQVFISNKKRAVILVGQPLWIHESDSSIRWLEGLPAPYLHWSLKMLDATYVDTSLIYFMDDIKYSYEKLPAALLYCCEQLQLETVWQSFGPFITTHRIFCAMGNKSMTTEQSTNMIYLHQVGTMLRHATSRSVCLLEEFSKGTLTEDCIGGTISHFANYDYPPKVLLSTHLTEIFAENYLPQAERIKCCIMSVLNPSGHTGNKNIIFLRRLVPGHELLCFGLHCAQLAGVPGEVIQRAASVLEDIHPKRSVRRKIRYNLAARDKQIQETENTENGICVEVDLTCYLETIASVRMHWKTNQHNSYWLFQSIMAQWYYLWYLDFCHQEKGVSCSCIDIPSDLQPTLIDQPLKCYPVSRRTSKLQEVRFVFLIQSVPSFSGGCTVQFGFESINPMAWRIAWVFEVECSASAHEFTQPFSAAMLKVHSILSANDFALEIAWPYHTEHPDGGEIFMHVLHWGDCCVDCSLEIAEDFSVFTRSEISQELRVILLQTEFPSVCCCCYPGILPIAQIVGLMMLILLEHSLAPGRPVTYFRVLYSDPLLGDLVAQRAHGGQLLYGADVLLRPLHHRFVPVFYFGQLPLWFMMKIKESQVPWDPGWFTWFRLEGKPNFMGEGMSRELPTRPLRIRAQHSLRGPREQSSPIPASQAQNGARELLLRLCRWCVCGHRWITD